MLQAEVCNGDGFDAFSFCEHLFGGPEVDDVICLTITSYMGSCKIHGLLQGNAAELPKAQAISFYSNSQFFLETIFFNIMRKNCVGPKVAPIVV